MTSSLNVSLEDPGVQKMLGGSSLAPGNRARSLVQIAGDVPDPTGQTNHRGRMSQLSLAGGKHEVVVVYKDAFMTVDVYLLDGQAPEVHLICPRCHKASRIAGDRKAIDFEPARANPAWSDIAATGDPVLAETGRMGRLSIEPFECAWEIGGDQHVAGGVHTGVSLCRLQLAIDNSRARDA